MNRSSAVVAVAGLAVAASIGAAQDPDAPRKKPLPGQVVIDTDHPSWLKRHGGKHLFICGPGDPEGFLYRGRRNADGTRDGDQAELIEKLIRHGGNSIYMQIVRSHGGDGRPDHNPFVDSDPGKGLDSDVLDQWEEWFTRMDESDILIYLFFYDDGARIWNTGDNVGAAERAFLQALVDRFEHHRNLIWIVGEESEEAYSTERVQRIAGVIRRADDHGHLVGNHHHSGTTFKSWRPGGALNHYAMQLTAAGKQAHQGAVEAFRKAEGKYQVIYSESTAASPDARHAWASAMGGLMPMLLEMDIASTPAEVLSRCRYLQEFFEATDFYTMQPHDELAAEGTQWALADPGRSYIAYAERLEGDIGLKKLAGGRYHLRWLDCRTGASRTEKDVSVPAGTGTFRRPAGIGRWCAVWITRSQP